MKVRIIGPSGAGKSWLARRLSQKLDIQLYDLDSIFWDNSVSSFNVKRGVEERDAMLRDVLKKDAWIIEGVQYSWTGATFSDAYVIYVLNPPPALCRMRILRRFVRRKLCKADRKKESVRSMLALLKWTRKFYEVNFPEIRQELEPYREKVIEIHSKKEIARLLHDK